MEDSELDEWFSESRERLEERFYKEAEKSPERAKERFDKDYKALVARFQKRQMQSYEQKRRSAAMRAPLQRMRARINLFFTMLGDRWKNRSHPIRKWLFERKIKRIIKDKSDL